MGTLFMFFQEPTTLIVVYKEELYANLVRKLVETKDDVDENIIVGTRDGSVRVVSWSEKVWLDNKIAGNIASKVLIIGDVKGADKLLPLIDLKYNEFGIKYGWAGDQAIITVDPKALRKEEEYNKFFEALQTIAVSDSYSKRVNYSLKAKRVEQDLKESNSTRKKRNVFSTIENIVLPIINPINSAFGTVAQLVVKSFKNKEQVKNQQYYYGLTQFYNNHLEAFLH